jgi:hypothetical protein
LPFGEALLIPVNIGDDPNIATTRFDKAVLDDVRLEESQAQGVCGEQRVLPTPSCDYFDW